MFGSYQRTLKNKVSCIGTGLHSGLKVSMTLFPALEDTGVTFIRKDISGKNPEVKADYLNVTKTMLGTTISNEDGVEVNTVEHLMAALWGCGIDNCIIELDASEIPIMDGSSEPFVFLLECAGVKEQSKTRRVIEILKEIKVTEGDKNNAFASIQPSESFAVSLEIDFGDKVIANQQCTFDTKDVAFKTELSRARTFGFEHEVEQMRSMGLARGGSLDNAIVVGKDGILNKDGLRYKDEFVRHKVLDCIGDVFLAGAHIKGTVKGLRSGHALNNKLLRELFSDKDAWRMTRWPDEQVYAATA